MSEEQVENASNKCALLGKLWPVLFPHMNVTRKVDGISIGIPKLLKKWKTYLVFIKLEERGEWLHHQYNILEARLKLRYKPILLVCMIKSLLVLEASSKKLFIKKPRVCPLMKKYI